VVVNNVNRVSYNGGRGGLTVRASEREQAAYNERHFQSTSNQIAHEQAMRNDRAQLASYNHGNPHTAAMSRVGERGDIQQQRVANGVRSGELTPHETRNIEHNEAQIHQQVRNDREANGGHLNQQERQQVNREQNHVSEQIHDDKHNDRERR